VFDADTSMKMLMQQLHARPVLLSQRTELTIPPEFEELVMACLEKDPDRRPQNAGELYRMAHTYRCRDKWTPDEAESWWRAHLPQLTGSLAARSRPDIVSSSVSA
jgi:eukaryotic-like serine/threonine-protein kinase